MSATRRASRDVFLEDRPSQWDHRPAAKRALASCHRILTLPPTPRAGAMPNAVYAAAGRLVAHPWAAESCAAQTTGAAAAIHDLLDHWWPRIRRGAATGEEMFRAGGLELWDSFMTDFPMGEYATVVADTVEAMAGDRLRVMRALELGAGIGNTTRILRGRTLDYLATDLKRFRGVRAWDFDEWAWPPGNCAYPPDLIVATNAAHCSADPDRLLFRCASALAPDGLLVLGEGNASETQPWYQDAVCSTLRGWYDRGGFRTPQEWLTMLEAAGFRSVGRVRLLDPQGRDLGGAYWGRA